MDSADDIIRAIEAAFAGVPCGQVTLHEAEVMDAYGSEVERRAARRFDPDDDWTKVSAASIEECPTALSFLDPESWRFYLPAYMRLALRRFGQPHNEAMDQAIYSLDGASPERSGTLNASQAGAVQRFLAFACEHEDQCDATVAKQALDAYWSSVP